MFKELSENFNNINKDRSHKLKIMSEMKNAVSEMNDTLKDYLKRGLNH